MIKLLKQLFCLHDYVIANPMDRILCGIDYLFAPNAERSHFMAIRREAKWND